MAAGPYGNPRGMESSLRGAVKLPGSPFLIAQFAVPPLLTHLMGPFWVPLLDTHSLKLGKTLEGSG